MSPLIRRTAGRRALPDPSAAFMAQRFPKLPQVRPPEAGEDLWLHGTTLHDALRLITGRPKRSTVYAAGVFASLPGLYLYPGQRLASAHDAAERASRHLLRRAVGTPLLACPTVLLLTLSASVEIALDEDEVLYAEEELPGWERVVAHVHRAFDDDVGMSCPVLRDVMDEHTRLLGRWDALAPTPHDAWAIRALDGHRIQPTAWAADTKFCYIEGIYK